MVVTTEPAEYVRPNAAFTVVAKVEDGLGNVVTSFNGPVTAALSYESVTATLGGTLPLWVFTDTLGIPALWIPAANSDNQQHDVNEHFVLRHFFQQTALYADVVSSRPV